MKEKPLDLTEQSEVFDVMSIGDIIDQTLQKKTQKEKAIKGLSTGFWGIDEVISGLQKGRLITVAARPGMGKTAFLLSLANNIAIKGNNSVAIFSSERSKQKITSRIIESETGMSVNKLINEAVKPVKRSHLEDIIINIAKSKIFLDDTPSISVEELIEKARKLKYIHDVDLIIVDYLELIKANSSPGIDAIKNEMLNTVVHFLKDIASELDIPVVLFSQMQGYGFEYNFTNKPGLNELPVSVSEISDVIMFLHRSDFTDTNWQDNRNVEIIIAKYDSKNNNTIVPLRYNESLAKFENI